MIARGLTSFFLSPIAIIAIILIETETQRWAGGGGGGDYLSRDRLRDPETCSSIFSRLKFI